MDSHGEKGRGLHRPPLADRSDTARTDRKQLVGLATARPRVRADGRRRTSSRRLKSRTKSRRRLWVSSPPVLQPERRALHRDGAGQRRRRTHGANRLCRPPRRPGDSGQSDGNGFSEDRRNWGVVGRNRPPQIRHPPTAQYGEDAYCALRLRPTGAVDSRRIISTGRICSSSRSPARLRMSSSSVIAANPSS